MQSPSNVFISFRRIRYHEASFAYRDLMFSGAVPWLSDHCITTEQALQFARCPDRLAPFLVDAITASNRALVLADDGYFQSWWTLLEYKHIIDAGLPTEIAFLGGAGMPPEYSARESGTVRVHTSLRSAVESICEQLGTSLVVYPQPKEYYHPSDEAFGLEVHCPVWLQKEIGQDSWYSRQGDTLVLHMTPVGGGHGADVLGALEKDRAAHGVRAYSLFEDELWRQVGRLQQLKPFGIVPVGYHKFPVPGMDSTAVGLSLQMSQSGGFCRYASLLVPHLRSHLQIACFVKGSLQRFHTLVPDIDEMIVTLSLPGGSHLQQSIQRGYELKVGGGSADDLLWARCARCLKRVDIADLAEGHCSGCRTAVLECLSVHCRNRKQADFDSLSKEALREAKRAAIGLSSYQGVYDLGLLCEGCFATLFVPGTMLAQLNEKAQQGMPTVMGPRSSLLVWWLATCMYGIICGGGSVYRWVLGWFAIITVFEPYEAGARTDPITPLNKRLHVLTCVPMLGCLLWILATSGRLSHLMPSRTVDFLGHPAALALTGSCVSLSIALRSLGLFVRYRETHLIYGTVCAGLYSVLLVWKYKALAAAGGAPLVAAAIVISSLTTVASLALLHVKRLTGAFSPDQLWDTEETISRRRP